MGFSGISIWQLLIVLVIVLLIFGTKRLKNIGSDMGGAIKGFKGAMSEAGKEKEEKEEAEAKPDQLEEAKAESADTVTDNTVKNSDKEKV